MARPRPSKFGSRGAGWCSRACRYRPAALVCQISIRVSGTGRPPESRTWPDTMIRCPCGSPARCVVRSASRHGDQAVAEQRAGHLRQPLREQHQRLLRVAEPGRLVRRVVERRVTARLRLHVPGQVEPARVRDDEPLFGHGHSGLTPSHDYRLTRLAPAWLTGPGGSPGAQRHPTSAVRLRTYELYIGRRMPPRLGYGRSHHSQSVVLSPKTAGRAAEIENKFATDASFLTLRHVGSLTVIGPPAPGTP